MNTQKISPLLVLEDGERLFVHSIFHTIQGEGPFAGERAVFVRLAGCNLRCPGCDTDYTSHSLPCSVEEILREVRIFKEKRQGIVVITGGEPFRQNISKLVTVLVACGYRVQIETNGTLSIGSAFREAFDNIGNITVVCSPKGRVHESVWQVCKDVKYVVDHTSVGPDGLPTEVLGLPAKEVSRPPEGWRGTIYVQPADTKSAAENSKNLSAAVESVMQHGYKLCLQLHKIIDME